MSPSPTVRAATPDDSDAFAACHLACWRESYTELWGSERIDEFDERRMAQRRRKEIESGNADHFIGEIDDEVVGIAIAGPTRDDDAPAQRELYAIYVRDRAPGHRAGGRPARGRARPLPRVALDVPGQPARQCVLRAPRLHSRRQRAHRLRRDPRDPHGAPLTSGPARRSRATDPRACGGHWIRRRPPERSVACSGGMLER